MWMGMTRADIGKWVTSMIPVETLVIDRYQKWRPLVKDSLEFIFTHLSEERLLAKIAEQFELAADTPPERRLIALISKMPGAAKAGAGAGAQPPPFTRVAAGAFRIGKRDVRRDGGRDPGYHHGGVG